MMNVFSRLKEMKILLIDDDEWIRDSLSLFFESERCHITALETAEEGLEALKNDTYDIIIVDYKLPGMDGLEFLKLVKASYPHAMTILTTAYGRKDIFLAARRIGIKDFIDKPFTTQRIEESLKRLMEEHG
jgi:DNA-binding NtrC family response regulator